MAIWQYEVLLVPTNEVVENSDLFKNNVELFLDNLNGWNVDKIPFDLIDEKLHKNEGWSEHVVLWGKSESNNVHMYIENDKVTEIVFRVDLRENSKEMIRLLQKIAKAINATILNSNYCIVENHINTIVDDIKKSPSFNFLKDPELFLKSLK